ESSLTKADFSDADLGFCDFRGADLRNAIFRGADLQYANFYRADLRGADFTGALNISKIKNIAFANVASAIDINIAGIPGAYRMIHTNEEDDYRRALAQEYRRKGAKNPSELDEIVGFESSFEWFSRGWWEIEGPPSISFFSVNPRSLRYD